MFRIKSLILAMCFGQMSVANANTLEQHFFGLSPKCISAMPIPTLIVSDVTRKGEIDDTISLYVYSKLEKLGCIKVIGIVSIFGNGGSSTKQVHVNLISRLESLKLSSWPIYHGPMKRMSFDRALKINDADMELLVKIAAAIKAHKKIMIAELGPVTVSASLLKSGLIHDSNLIKILMVGGRSSGEQFTQNPYLPFAFRDMNVAEDRMAIKYLLNHHSRKLWTVTYKTGLGQRMISPDMVSAIGSNELTLHANRRAKKLKIIGYRGMIPSWDTWTSVWFLKGGSEQLGCKITAARMAIAEHGYKPSDSMQLQLLEQRSNASRAIEACHEVLE